MCTKLTSFVAILLLLGFGSLQAQTEISYKILPDVAISGDEYRDMSNVEVVESNGTIAAFAPISAAILQIVILPLIPIRLLQGQW